MIERIAFHFIGWMMVFSAVLLWGLILFVGVAFLISTAWAEESIILAAPHTGMVYMPGGVKPDGDVAEIKLDRDGYVALNPCLAKMEAAMRAMEPFALPKDPHMTKEQSGWWGFHGIVSDAQGAMRLAAVEQWIDTKVKCWRQP